MSEITASHLSISDATIKARMKNILLKLGASDRTHAVSIATSKRFFAVNSFVQIDVPSKQYRVH
jgi:DNA-binding NarL/FixJ family response regulator